MFHDIELSPQQNQLINDTLMHQHGVCYAEGCTTNIENCPHIAGDIDHPVAICCKCADILVETGKLALKPAHKPS